MSTIIIDEALIKRILKEEVEEEVYAGVTAALGATATDIVAGEVESGKIGIIVSLAIQRVANILWYPTVNGKVPGVYSNGLYAEGLASTANGVDVEIPLLIIVPEKQKWALRARATAGGPTSNYRLRVRKYPIADSE